MGRSQLAGFPISVDAGCPIYDRSAKAQADPLPSAKGAGFRSNGHILAYIVQGCARGCNRDAVTQRRSPKGAIAPKVDHIAVAEGEEQAINVEEAIREGIFGGGLWRALWIVEVVVGDEAVPTAGSPVVTENRLKSLGARRLVASGVEWVMGTSPLMGASMI